jgi:hypothetical protein
MMCQTELGIWQITQTSINKLSFQNLFFPLHDAILFQGHGKSQAQDLQLRIVETRFIIISY